MVERVPMTRSGFETLQSELSRLRNEERPAVIQAIAEAREHGDLSENAEYHAARERQSFIEGRIAELEYLIGRSEVIDVSKLNGENVKFGATVTMADVDTDEETTYQIVGQVEADVSGGRISVTSPVARALMGKTVGDVVEVVSPASIQHSRTNGQAVTRASNARKSESAWLDSPTNAKAVTAYPRRSGATSA